MGELPRKAFVELSIYDMQGRCVSELIRNVMPAGRHRITWSAGGFASGAYLYRLDTEEYTETRLMIFAK